MMLAWEFPWRSQNIDERNSPVKSFWSEHFLPSSGRFRPKETLVALACVALIALSYLALVSSPSSLYGSIFTLHMRSFFGMEDQQHHHAPAPHITDDQHPSSLHNAPPPATPRSSMEEILEKAAMPGRTVIITTLNAAWAENNTMIDLFLESFHYGDGTESLLKHLIVVSLDQKAHDRCVKVHTLCLKIRTGGVNFSGEQLLLTADYVKMMWRRIKFLRNVLEMNYSFVFTDADVLWFRNPFPRLQSVDADLQIACDRYNGRPTDVHNMPNAGFVFVRANKRTLDFYKYWYQERWRDPKMADQEVLNAIKGEEEVRKIGMRMRFLDTQFFGGFCAIAKTDMKRAMTMHATCCKGLEPKLVDLKAILEGWKAYRQLQHSNNTATAPAANDDDDGHASTLRPPKACPKTFRRHRTAARPPLHPATTGH